MEKHKISSWNKYSSKLLLTFKNPEIEKDYQAYVYNKRSFLVVTLFVFICVFVNTMVFYNLSDPNRALNAPITCTANNSTISTNSTNASNTTCISTPVFMLKTTFTNHMYAWLSFCFSVLSAIMIIPMYFAKSDCIWSFRILSLMVNFAIRLFFSTMSVWYNQVFPVNAGNSVIYSGIQGTSALIFVLFFDYTYYINGTVQMTLVAIVLGLAQKTVYTPLQMFFITLINMIFYVMFFYFLEKVKRDGFYFSSISKKDNKNLQNLFENLGMGLIIYKKNVPVFINKFIKEKIFLLDSVLKPGNGNSALKLFIESCHSDIFKNEKIREYINNFIFDDMKFINATGLDDDELYTSFQNIKIKHAQNDIDKSQVFTSYMEILTKNKESFQNFKLLGVKETMINNETVNIQIFAKYDNNSETVEILYNDVTNISKVEEYKAEIKYKTLFLSKAAHEFKNPLFCVTELINQIGDEEVDLSNSINNIQITKTEANHVSESSNHNKLMRNYNRLKNTLQNIKNLSDYMIILVKDFDFLSQKELNKQLNLNISKTNLTHVVTFAANIFITRVNLNNKKIIITYNIDKNMPDIIKTDETRLKQILINLLSNSYKFTGQGEIRLDVSIDEESSNYAKFSIVDTGIGIPEDKIPLLTTPFCKLENKENPHGAGLGLGIVIDMVNLIGKGFEIKSVYGKGTSISFLLPLTPASKDKSVNISSLSEMQHDRKKTKKSHFSRDNVNKFNPIVKTESDRSDEVELIFDDKLLDNPEDELCEKQSKATKELDICLYINDNDKNIGTRKSTISISSKVDSHNNKSVKLNDSNLYKTNHNNLSTNENFSLKFSNFNRSNKPYKIIVVEDEVLIRQSEIRVVKNYFKSVGEICEIISCADGVECLNILYQGKLNGIKYDAILTDESMNFIKGTLLIDVLKSIISEQIIFPLKIFMATSYDKKKFSHISNIDDVFTKPITLFNVEKIHTLLLGQN